MLKLHRADQRTLWEWEWLGGNANSPFPTSHPQVADKPTSQTDAKVMTNVTEVALRSGYLTQTITLTLTLNPKP